MNVNDFIQQSLGEGGAEYVADTTATTGRFFAIQALEDTVISTLTAPRWGGTLTDIPVPAGLAIYGLFNGFTLTSGKVVAYKR